MTTLDILRRGCDRVARGWCPYFLAADRDGRALPDPESPAAVAWCARGAVGVTVDRVGSSSAAEDALYLALPPEWRNFGAEHGHGNAVAGFNNENRQEDVVALFYRAIAMLENGVGTTPYPSGFPRHFFVHVHGCGESPVAAPDWAAMAGPPFTLLTEAERAGEAVPA